MDPFDDYGWYDRGRVRGHPMWQFARRGAPKRVDGITLFSPSQEHVEAHDEWWVEVDGKRYAHRRGSVWLVGGPTVTWASIMLAIDLGRPVPQPPVLAGQVRWIDGRALLVPGPGPGPERTYLVWHAEGRGMSPDAFWYNPDYEWGKRTMACREYTEVELAAAPLLFCPSDPTGERGVAPWHPPEWEAPATD